MRSLTLSPIRAGLLCPLAVCVLSTLSNAARAEVVVARFDMPTLPLAVFNAEFSLDYGLPPIEADIISTKIHLQLQTDHPLGSMDASDFAVLFQPPVADPADISGLRTYTYTDADTGWSGHGTFTFDLTTDYFNGAFVPAPPPARHLLAFVQILNYDNVRTPPMPGQAAFPMGGALIDSYIEVTYVVPAPASAGLIAVTAVVGAGRRRRCCSRRA